MKITIQGKSEEFMDKQYNDLLNRMHDLPQEPIEIKLLGITWKGIVTHVEFNKKWNRYDDAPWLQYSVPNIIIEIITEE